MWARMAANAGIRALSRASAPSAMPVALPAASGFMRGYAEEAAGAMSTEAFLKK